MAHPRFRSLSEDMEMAITKLADQGLGSRRITRQFELDYATLPEEARRDAKKPPSRSTVDNFLHWWRNQRQEHPELDAGQEPWSLGALADPGRSQGVTLDDAALILRVMRKARAETERGVRRGLVPAELAPRLSLATARWMARLARIAPGAAPVELWMAAGVYAGRERLALVRGERFDTREMDEEIDPDSKRPFSGLLEHTLRFMVELVDAQKAGTP